MFTFSSMFRRSNQKMLQSALTKTMLLSFESSEGKLHDNLFDHKSILMVNMEETERPVPEPGQPEEPFPEVQISHNITENKSYIYIDKEYFDSMEQPEVDEFIYQFYNQVEPGHTAQYTIDVPQENGTIREVLVQVEAKEYTVQEKEEKEKESEDSESCDSGDAEKEAEEATDESKEETKEEVHRMQEAEKEQNPRYSTAKATWGDQMTKKEHKVFQGYDVKEIPDIHLKEIHKVEEILKHSIVGDDGGKSKSISPAKRLNMRAIVTESSENEYITKHGEEGKDIKINVIVDRSGSMHGRPSTESNILIAALNNLAFEFPELDVEIMLSETSNYFNFQLPVHNPDSSELWHYNGTGGSEGLARTFNANFDRMKNANVNLVYTDGDIYDEAIDKAFMQSQEIELVGMYVNEDFTEDEVMKYHEKNAKYFTHTIIRDNMLSLVNELANRIYLSKDGK